VTSRPVLLALAVVMFSSFVFASDYHYIRIGREQDVQTHPSAGIAMMGGGKDLDEAFRWLCRKADGGDFLVLSAVDGDDDYNPYVNKLCKLNSVAALVIPDRQAASNPTVVRIIRQAEAMFVVGGDQARYVNFWRGTPVQDAINENLAEGKPIGGTSAGLAIQGEFSYGALNDPPDDSMLGSKDALLDPYFYRVTVLRDFFKIPNLGNTITDSHFAKRDRMGRTLVFLARIMQNRWSSDPREIAVDESSAVLVEADGQATVVGSGKGAYFLRLGGPPEACKTGAPLTLRNITVHKVMTGTKFDISTWTGVGGVDYQLAVVDGSIHSTQAEGAIY
jgi:cyanophycinase